MMARGGVSVAQARAETVAAERRVHLEAQDKV